MEKDREREKRSTFCKTAQDLSPFGSDQFGSRKEEERKELTVFKKKRK
jgi:hypothetical protein